MVYVGGAVVSLYINDPAAEDVRPTKDIDISIEITSLAELESTRLVLTEKGFYQSPEDNVTCRFRFDDIKVDVMSTKEIGWAPANPWFGPGFDHLKHYTINDNIRINVLPLAYFLATKFTAFHSRGKDPRTSHDFEDIVYILDNRIDLVEQINNAPDDVKNYLRKEFSYIVNERLFQEAALGNLYYETQTERYAMIISKLNKIISVG